MIRESIIWISLAIILLIILPMERIQFTSAEGWKQVESTQEIVDSTSQKDTDKDLQKQYNKSDRLTHEEILQLTDEFMNLLVQEIDEDYQVRNFDTKEELLEAFEEVTTHEVAYDFVDFYYTEELGKLYIIPTETPPWFMEENDYDVIQLNQEGVKVIQENDSVLYGEYTIELVFTKVNGSWKITEVTYPE
ncbi:hypothetical protein SAMN05216389_10918 [Oceanobacillus limi]|uniref:DUF3993 domain-containing protein n=1 Tax=Oceanobacillus limi TaxID=930131 RepID=A0A1I0DN97_9BACI|nr:hypothetical protein [Oceanobacillus limi]SET33177.1 hypothetical protein SAMN05216389_10918 [Oceanobacillus limi]